MAGRSPNAGFRPGDHWVICDRCGVAHRHHEVKREWTGLVVCTPCWEPRHPQDFVRARKDTQAAVGLVRQEPTDLFRSVTGTESGNQENTIPSGTFDNSL
jgi:hypothetical protein